VLNLVTHGSTLQGVSDNMELKLFSSKYLADINKWLTAHGKTQVELVDMPSLGFVAENVAAGFLRQGEYMGVIDAIITNPEASSEDRNLALDLIFERLVITSKQCNIKVLFGFSEDEHTLSRSERYGFKKSDMTLMVRGI